MVEQTTRQSNTAHPRQSLFLRKMSFLGRDSSPPTLYTLDRALYHLYMYMSNLIATEEERAEKEGEGGEEGDRPHSQPSTVEGKALFNPVRTTCTWNFIFVSIPGTRNRNIIT